MSKIKVAIIGSGQIARVSHIPAYLTMDNVEIVGVSDVNFEAAKQLAEDFQIPNFYKSHIELLEDAKPDAVSICVPNKFHYPIVMDCLNANCNVMCEKPPAINAAQAKEMADVAEEKGLILTYDFHFRHGKNVSIVKEKIENNELGKLYFARAKWLRKAGVPGWGNFINKELQGGGPLIDIGAHMLDLALYLLDYPKISYVSATSSNLIGTTRNDGYMGKWDSTKYTVEDGLFGMIHFENGMCLELETTFALNMKEKDLRAVDIFGDAKGVSLFPMEVYSGIDEEFNIEEIDTTSSVDLHTLAIQNFIKSCDKQEELLVTGRQGAYVQELIEALYESADTNKPIFIK